MRLLLGPDQGALGGHDRPLVAVPNGHRHAERQGRAVLLRSEAVILEHAHVHVHVGNGRDLGQFQVVAGLVDPVAGRQHVRVVAKDVGQDGVVIVVGDGRIDAAGHFRERQLPHVDRGHELLPGIDIGLDRLLVRQPRGVGLRPQGRRFVRRRKPACQQVGLEPIDFVGEVGQSLVHPDRLLGHQDGEVGVADLGGQIAAGPPQGQFGVVQSHLGRGRLQARAFRRS